MPYDEARAAAYDATHAEQFVGAAPVVDALRSLLPPSGGRVLELGVGTGRLAIPLASLAGVKVWGVDDSAPMLGQLLGKPGGERVRAVHGDFAEVGELVDGPFDLVFVAFNTLFELPTQEAQLACVVGAGALLGDGGVFAVEAIAPDLTRLEQTVSALAVSPDAAVLQATRHDPSTQRVTGADVTIGAGGSVGLAPWSIRYVSVPELDLMARLAGLRLQHRWGSWHGEPFTAASPAHVSVYGRAAT